MKCVTHLYQKKHEAADRKQIDHEKNLSVVFWENGSRRNGWAGGSYPESQTRANNTSRENIIVLFWEKWKRGEGYYKFCHSPHRNM